MFKTLRPRAAWMTLGAISLLGCSTPEPAAPPPVQAAFSVHTPVKLIAADARGKAILNRDVPGLLSNPQYPAFCDMSLAELAPLSGGKLTQATLTKVQADLAGLDAQGR